MTSKTEIKEKQTELEKLEFVKGLHLDTKAIMRQSCYEVLGGYLFT